MRKSLLGAAVLGLLLSGCGIVQTTSHAHMKMDMARSTAVTYVPRVRTYYIAADEVKWDYAPDDRNDIAGRPWNDDEKVFVENGPTVLSQTAGRHREMLRILLAGEAKAAPLPEPANLDAPACGVIRFAL